MPIHEHFMQLRAETHGAQFQAIVFALTCAFAAYWAASATTQETKKQYGQALTRETRRIWWKRFFKLYFLPSVFLTELSMQIFTRSKLYEWFTLYVNGNRELHITALSIGYGAFVLMIPMLFCKIKCLLRLPKLEPEPLPSPPVKKGTWVLDSSGEYFPISCIDGDDVLLDVSMTRTQRISEWSKTKRIRKFLSIVLIGVIIWFVIAAIRESGMAMTFLGVFGFPIFLLWIVLSIQLWGGREKFVGPEPVKPQGRDTVAEQQAYGDADAANIFEIHKALSGGDRNSSNAGPSQPRFEE
jgi:hypothetical protein